MSRLSLPPGGVLAAATLLATFMAAAVLVAGARPPSPPDEPRLLGLTSLSSELERCRALGADAGSDPACRKAWRDSRRSFLDGEIAP